MFNINEKLARKYRNALDRDGWKEETRLHVVWGFEKKLELLREYIGLLEFELDQLRRVEGKDVLIVPSELVDRGRGKYVLYSKPAVNGA
ncbi:MAG: hypothetical protein Q7S74_03055 [Nanoarchaeota archaeon]|nr:hypothetical protein [Nanoarchaeota archaeon]